MAILRTQTAFNADSALPRDSMICTLWFDHVFDTLEQTDYDGLANDIATMFVSGWSGAACEVQTKIYDMGDSIPREARATATKNVGLHPPSPMPREIAVCLSFYATRNLPRTRGRIYLPAAVGMASGSLDARPTSTIRTKALGLATTANQSIPDIGGIDVKHIVWSDTDRVGRQVTHYYVDDEWDTVRKRGFRPTTRQLVHREG